MAVLAAGRVKGCGSCQGAECRPPKPHSTWCQRLGGLVTLEGTEKGEAEEGRTECSIREIKHHAQLPRLATDELQRVLHGAQCQLADHEGVPEVVEHVASDLTPVVVDVWAVDNAGVGVAVGGAVGRDGPVSEGGVFAVDVACVDAEEG
jgi:hypothetical protein